MKIELPSTLPDRSGAGADGGKAAPAARAQAGRGFADAVRGAQARREAPGNPETRPRADAKGSGEPESTQTTDETAPAPTAEDAAARDAQAAGSDPLRLVLDLFGAARAPAADDAAPPAEDTEPNGAGVPGGTAGENEGALAGTEEARRPLRLDVLRMETHFEPRQDGTTISEMAGGSAAADGAADLSAGANLLADSTSLVRDLDAAAQRAPGPKAAADASAAAAGPARPVRFEEAVARLASPLSASGAPVRDAAENERGAAARGQPGEAASAAPGSESDGGEAGNAAISPAGERGLAARSRRGEETSAALGRAGASPARADAPRAANDAVPADGRSGAAEAGIASQVAGRIAEALGDAVPAGGSAAPPPGSRQAEAIEGHLRLRAGGAALRTLTLQLQPEHLGTLEVSMRLRDGQLALEISASRPETAAALADDQVSLRKLLETAGFSLDEGAIAITVRDAAAPSAAARPSDGQPAGDGRASGGSGEGRGSGEARGGEGGRREGGGDERRPPAPREDGRPRPGTGGRGSSTYL